MKILLVSQLIFSLRENRANKLRGALLPEHPRFRFWPVAAPPSGGRMPGSATGKEKFYKKKPHTTVCMGLVQNFTSSGHIERKKSSNWAKEC